MRTSAFRFRTLVRLAAGLLLRSTDGSVETSELSDDRVMVRSERRCGPACGSAQLGFEPEEEIVEPYEPARACVIFPALIARPRSPRIVGGVLERQKRVEVAADHGEWSRRVDGAYIIDRRARLCRPWIAEHIKTVAAFRGIEVDVDEPQRPLDAGVVHHDGCGYADATLAPERKLEGMDLLEW